MGKRSRILFLGVALVPRPALAGTSEGSAHLSVKGTVEQIKDRHRVVKPPFLAVREMPPTTEQPATAIPDKKAKIRFIGAYQFGTAVAA